MMQDNGSVHNSSGNNNGAGDGSSIGGDRPVRRPLAVRKPKPTAGWTDGAATGPLGASSIQPAVVSIPVAEAPLPPHQPQAQHSTARGQGKAGQSAAERSNDLRSAYRARMAAMRTSRVGGARRQARNAPEPAAEEEEKEENGTVPASGDVPAPAGQANALPALHLSRSQRKRLARSARSPAVLDAALARAGVANPASRAALADAIATGVGSGDGAVGERITRALAS
ncbi:hypothetical protein pdul_cds_332 [Pandoravirus dulcis]|uniref:Uncharacterized protein n=1 Tax=Pandoravirus dulcis TaxID=1349409 RepID=S4VPV5_9VIRU|nr:hypothetical protein pdul_cds_332 [Pandoravirus dulcis]AGO82343.1 hypothetical protein pdul_cds_332 [Pandoravirus dulcis]